MVVALVENAAEYKHGSVLEERGRVPLASSDLVSEVKLTK